ncbi:MAG: T9SS type A sorting domain-containing protein [Prevotella sp.]|nr:T9SS type A sorting domain-containing protein [Prevotella sp.]MBR6867584.1 T9SS type A sorting domain-containing protein [Prevotella sp.]
MKKKFYSLLLLLLAVVTAHAADAKWCLVVESAGGETIAIGADQKPVIKTVADGYELRYGETVTAFTWSQLKKVSIKETEPTAVEEVSMKPAIQVAPGEVAIQGAEPGSVAQVFSANGQLVQSARVAANGSVSLSTQNLPAGQVYIIKTTKSTFKIAK